MTKIKTQDLTGAALDWAVAKCEGVRTVLARYEHTMTGVCVLDAELVEMGTDGPQELRYSRDWAHGGPIIEREALNIMGYDSDKLWEARRYAFDGTLLHNEYGPTPLIAAMRCYVDSNLGDEVDVPEELT